MNYNDYQKIMIEENLITTVQSERCLQNAMTLQNNIKAVLKMSDDAKSLYPYNPLDDIERMKNEKDRYILTAIKLSIPKSNFETEQEEKWWNKRCKLIGERLGADIATLYNLKGNGD